METAKDWDDLPAVLTIEETAHFLRRGYRCILQLCHQRGFPAMRLGRRWLINRDGLRRWIWATDRAERAEIKTPAATGAAEERQRQVFYMAIISENRLQEKQLKRLMGEDYYTKPALRLILSGLGGVQAVEDMDGGRSVEWGDLKTERERKIAMVYFWQGVEQAERWREDGIL
ncbi:hypothetical protein PTH_2876 [Pelotomaculum thermopropionicum SI]|uniref:Helix-turn-helix domain-containing protein n=1 Tax=Pelotomaculum thermopropionicum (strain DSM 13744 / JCM 10971 / SI) TaxID=370438 RepID=A5CY67_PELTS|nr:hypothetical protein PTH_2876 [Pelotomaculum thermopropionicum SI]